MSLFTVIAALVLGEVPETYVVQAGDSCDAIVRKVWGDPKRITELHRWNDLGPVPHKLKAGQLLKLRGPAEAPAGPEATLTFLKPAVRARHLADWSPATLGMGLFRLDEVNTLRRAGAALRFKDESTLVMDENALVVIYGEAVKAKEPSGLSLVDGELRVALAALRQKPLPVATPSAAVEAGKEAQGVVAVDGAQTSRLSLFEGTATVEASGTKLAVKQNEGTRVRLGLGPEVVTPLPDAPALTQATPRLIVWRGAPTPLTIEWAPAARAVRYRVQVGLDELFVDRVDDQLVDGTSATVALSTQAPLRVRVIAFDERGLQSRPSSIHSVSVVTVGEGLGEAGFVTHRAPAPLPVMVPEGLSMRLDRAPVVPPLSLPVGRHALEFVDAQGGSVSTVEVVVRPRPPSLRVEGAELVARFDDPIPAELPPTIRKRPMQRRDGTTWTAPVPPQGALEVEWLDLPLVRVERGK
jgi:hypothetical protein